MRQSTQFFLCLLVFYISLCRSAKTPIKPVVVSPKNANKKSSPSPVAIRTPEQVGREIGTLIADTTKAYCSSGAFGYVIGFGTGVCSAKIRRMFGLKGFHGMGIKRGMQWGELCATFTFFEEAIKISRGTADKWNKVLGGTLSGMVLSRNQDPITILRQGAVFGGFAYVFSGFPDPTKEEPPAANDKNKNTKDKKR